MGIPGRGCRMGIPDREYRMGIPDSIPVEETHTASYSKAFIALNVVIQKFHDFVLFSVCVFFFYGFLENTGVWYKRGHGTRLSELFKNSRK